jgi:hypothetical protein
VTVTSFPEPGRRWQISVEGGNGPCWRKDGREIFFKSLDGRLMAVDFKAAGAAVEIGTPRVLFGLPSFFEYDVMPDGKSIVAVVPPTAGMAIPLTVVSDWTAGLEKQ